jgi:DNA-binding NarL/FixJ family response regulator
MVRRLLIVEDEPMVATLLRETLTSAGFDVRTARNALEATRVATRFDPDIAILDINLGSGASGVDLAYILHQRIPGIALIFLTRHPDLRTAGFSKDDVPPGCGFIRKDLMTESSKIVDAIEEVVAEQRLTRQDRDPARPLGNLTATQIEVLRMVSQGYTNSEIAKVRRTSVRAVEQVLNAVFNTLEISVDGELNPRIEAVRKFIAVAGIPERS